MEAVIFQTLPLPHLLEGRMKKEKKLVLLSFVEERMGEA